MSPCMKSTTIPSPFWRSDISGKMTITDNAYSVTPYSARYTALQHTQAQRSSHDKKRSGNLRNVVMLELTQLWTPLPPSFGKRCYRSKPNRTLNN